MNSTFKSSFNEQHQHVKVRTLLLLFPLPCSYNCSYYTKVNAWEQSTKESLSS